MFKLIVLAALVYYAAAQGGGMASMARMMAMMRMMGNQSGGQTGTTGTTGQTGTSASGGMMGGMMGGMGALLNNPAMLCRQTEGFRPIPCRTWSGICDVISMQTYNMPGLLSCSPMGFGCCLKDALSLMMVQNL